MDSQIDIKITMKKRGCSWKDLRNFQKEFSEYCKYMGYCPLNIYEPIDCGRALLLSIKGGSACGFPHISNEEFIESLNEVFPKYNFELDF